MVSALNLGIVAHVDAGKTSLTERLLFSAGVIHEIGSVDDGSTQTDTLALERQRGITIRSAVVSFGVGDLTVNLIDTPGHPDFIAEVERALGVLDGAVLVISAVEGVQAQTRVLMRTLQRLRIPALLFVNKIDRAGADDQRVLRDIRARLTRSVVPMGKVRGPGTPAADFAASGPGDAGFTAALADVLADHDEALLAAFVEDETAVSYQRLRTGLAAAARQGLVYPVYFGSALTGAGVAALTDGIRDLLPRAAGAADGPVAGTVFKVERGAAGEKVAYVRMLSGTVRARERVRFGSAGPGPAAEGGQISPAAGGGQISKVTSIGVFDRGPAAPREQVTAGQIGTLRGLDGVQVGDRLGSADAAVTAHRPRVFAPPTLETVVVPCRPADQGALRAALGLLAEQDLLINVRQDDTRQEIVVSLYGEVQKEVIQATLADDFGIDVGFRESTTLYVERPSGTGAAAEFMADQANPFRATAGFRIDPAAAGSGVGFRLGIEPGALPAAFRKAIEETVRQTLREGLRGWPVTDCTVTLTRSGYTPPPPSGWSKWSTSAADFRGLTPLVLMTALLRADTRVHEPVHRFTLEIPADTLALVLSMLARLHATPGTPELRGSSCFVEGDIPAVRVHRLRQQLASLTRGEGVLDTALDRYQPVQGQIPVRPRSDHNPLNRKEYLLHWQRRAAGRPVSHAAY
jgi:ribosomal protection tetracycline resistance protein